MLSKVCEKSPNDSQIIPEEQFTKSFDSANFFIQYKPETKEFFFSSYYYLIFPDYVKTWSKAVKEIQALVSKEAPETKVEVNSVGQLGKHISSYDSYMQKLGNSLGTTVNHYNNAHKELQKIDKDVVKIASTNPSVEALIVDKPQSDN